MKILTFVKHVPTKAVLPRIAESGDRIEDGGLTYEVNETDLYAIEEAIHQNGIHGGDVMAVTIGPARAKEALHVAMAKGVSQVRHILDSQFQGTNPVANVLAAEGVAKDFEPNIILCGVQAEDDLQGQFGIMLGAALGLPTITAVTEINVNADYTSATIIRDIGAGFSEEIEVDLPCVLTVQFGIRPIRYTSIMSIVRMKRKPVDVIEMGSFDEAQEQGSRITELCYPEKEGKCEIMEGTPDEVAHNLLEKLLDQGVLQNVQ